MANQNDGWELLEFCFQGKTNVPVQYPPFYGFFEQDVSKIPTANERLRPRRRGLFHGRLRFRLQPKNIFKK